MECWYTIFYERLHYLIPRPLKWLKTDPINIGDVVLFIFNENPGLNTNTWKLGIVTEIRSKNSIGIEYPSGTDRKGNITKKVLHRCPRDISLISAANELPINSKEYFNQIIC